MKKVILITISIFLLSFSIINAQFGIGSPKVIEEIKQSKLMVVLFDEAFDYNDFIQQYVEKNWLYGEYEFINEKDLEQYEKRKDLFFYH